MRYLITLLFFLLVFNLTAQENYSRARVLLDGKELKSLAAFGIDIHEGFYKKGFSFETDYSETEIRKLKDAGYTVEIMIEDVGQFYRDRSAAQKDLQIDRSSYTYWEVPQNWEYGSMAGFYTLDEAMAELDSMHALYPELITPRAAISEDTLTFEGRKQWWLKISDNPGTDEDEPEVLYTSIHHAREVISLQQQIFFMWYLLENYETDEEIKYLIDNTEMYFVPVINPDGLQYNCTTNPQGGGMWRKNRRDNEDGSYGVDPNRNYGYLWGLDDEGSSPHPSDATYRGPAPFSEPENKNMRDFCNAHDFKIALNYHSHGNLLLSPWGYTPEPPEDSAILIDYSVLMARENSYVYGPGNTAIYPTNGASDDWMYGEQETKHEILSYTPEIGGSSDGHWAEMARIIPLCQEQMWQNMSAARLVGKYAIAEDLNPIVIGETEGYFKFNIKRMGLLDTETFTVSITPLDESIVEIGDAVDFQEMDLLEVRKDSITYLLDAGLENGTEFRFLLEVDNGLIKYADTITKYFGEELSLFYDDCETMDHWTSNDWDITDEDYFTPEYSITDSPDDNYPDNKTAILNIDTIIDLSEMKLAFLKFWSKWEIEEGYDYVQVLISEADKNDWVSLDGKYSSIGTKYQDPGQPVFDGYQDWVYQDFNISEYAGQKIKFRFWLRSDFYVNEDGFYFDEFEVTGIEADITSEGEEFRNTDGLMVSVAYPNPAHQQFRVQYQMKENSDSHFEVYDAMGKQVLSQAINATKGVLTINSAGWQKGIYLYRITSPKESSTFQKVVIQ